MNIARNFSDIINDFAKQKGRKVTYNKSFISTVPFQLPLSLTTVIN